VSLLQAKQFMRVPQSYVDEDSLIGGFVQAAREYGEIMTGLALAKRTWTQVMDAFPYFTDTVQSQLAYPPSYYSLPRYSTTLWNYSQMIKLWYNPVISVERMRYIDTTGAAVSLLQDKDFVLDRQSMPARIFPLAGQYWPGGFYVANELQIDFTAGYDPDPTAVDQHVVSPIVTNPAQQPDNKIVSGVPQMIILGIYNLIAYWYTNRGSTDKVPQYIDNIFLCNSVHDFAPSRG
jgi:hypothetical protein